MRDDFQTILASDDLEALAASGTLKYEFPKSVAGCVTGPGGNEA